LGLKRAYISIQKSITLERSADAVDLRLLVERAGGAPCPAPPPPPVPLLVVLPLVRLTLPLFAPLSACTWKAGSGKGEKGREGKGREGKGREGKGRRGEERKDYIF